MDKTDIEIIREMLTRCNIAFLEEPREVRINRWQGDPEEAGTNISVGEDYPEIRRTNEQKPHVGYADFHSTFYFDVNGNLINIGCWE